MKSVVTVDDEAPATGGAAESGTSATGGREVESQDVLLEGDSISTSASSGFSICRQSE